MAQTFAISQGQVRGGYGEIGSGPEGAPTAPGRFWDRVIIAARCFHLETRKPSVATAANSKHPVTSAPRIATSRGRIGAKAPQTPDETNIQRTNPASRKRAVGFGPGLIGE